MPQLRSRSRAPSRHDGDPSFLFIIALVAVLVAAVILVFFGLGYLLGRVFL